MSFAADKQRDKKLRRQILFVLHLALGNSPSKTLYGRTLVREVNSIFPPDQQFTGDPHAHLLLRELERKGYLVERDSRTHKSQAFGLDYCEYQITDKGIGLLNETEPVDGDVEDERL